MNYFMNSLYLIACSSACSGQIAKLTALSNGIYAQKLYGKVKNTGKPNEINYDSSMIYNFPLSIKNLMNIQAI